jgi:hypothetical protein
MCCCGWIALQATKFISRPSSSFGIFVINSVQLSVGDWTEAEVRIQNGCK